MRRNRTASLGLALVIALAGCGAERTTEDEGVIDGAASGNEPERSTAVNDTSPHRPGQPDTSLVP